MHRVWHTLPDMEWRSATLRHNKVLFMQVSCLEYVPKRNMLSHVQSCPLQRKNLT